MDGRVRVCEDMCATCIFRPGNLMDLRPGRVRQMVDYARKHDSTIVCHKTLDDPLQAACRGFFERFPTPPLQIAERIGIIDWINPDTAPSDITSEV